jgi:hypothetical protein
MKRIASAALCLAIPALLILNAWQGSRYGELLDQVSSLEQEQERLLQANQDTIARIAYEESPSQVEQRVARTQTLTPADPANVIRLSVAADATAGEQP